MQIPSSFAVAFDEEMAVIHEVARYSDSRLRILCESHHWLYDSRKKTVDSAMAKLEMGSHPSLSGMKDLFAATIVVPTHTSIAGAVEAVDKEFDVEVGPQRTTDPKHFPYDDVHVIASLGSKVAPQVVPEVIRLRQFEIQIRTGLQFAWWRATHDTVYKDAVPEWAVQRVASQARATLELLDGVLADIEKSAELQILNTPLEYPESPVAEDWVMLWQESDRPADLARFCAAVDGFLATTSISPALIRERLETSEFTTLIASSELTPVQVVLLAICQLEDFDAWTARLADSQLRLFITRESLRDAPTFSEIPEALRVGM